MPPFCFGPGLFCACCFLRRVFTLFRVLAYPARHVSIVVMYPYSSPVYLARLMMIVQVSIADWLRASVMQAWQMCLALISRALANVSRSYKVIDTDTLPGLCDPPFVMPSILIINPNSTESMTKSLEGLVKSFGFPDVRAVRAGNCFFSYSGIADEIRVLHGTIGPKQYR